MYTRDIPLYKAVEEAERIIESYEGHAAVFQKFTCSYCGERLTMEKPNIFYTHGTCDKCNHTTKIDKCGFMLVLDRRGLLND
jgi:hypothetical protein